MNKLTKNYIYNSLYQVMLIIIPLITTPYLTRTLGKTFLGIDSYVLSIVQLTNVIGALGTNTYAYREIAYVRDDKNKLISTFWELVIIRIVLCTVSCLVYVCIALRSEYRTIFGIQTITIISYFFDVSWFFIGMEEMKPVVIRNVCVKAVATACIFLLVREPEDIYIYVVIYALSQALGTLLIFIQLRSLITIKRLGSIHITRHLKSVILLFLPQAASALYVQFDKTMLGILSSDISSVSIYDKGQVITKTPILFAFALSAVLMPRMANEISSGHMERVKQLVTKALDWMLLFSIPIAVGMFLIARVIVPWYLGSEYLESVFVVQILSPIIVAISTSNVTGAQFLTAADSTKYLTISYTVSAVLNLIGNFFLIPVWNEKGAAFTTLLAESLVVCIQLYAVRKLLGKLYLLKRISKKLIAAAVMGIVVFMMQDIGNTIEVVILQIITGAVIYFFVLLLLKDDSIWEFVNIGKEYLRERK
ncbi:MAG: flippase [Dorea sp.]|nr:flippase [Dorea sp.]